MRLNLTPVRAYDRLTDRQPQSDPNDAPLAAPALEFVKQARRIARRQSRAIVLYYDTHERPVFRGGNQYAGSRRSVLGDIVEEIGEQLRH